MRPDPPSAAEFRRWGVDPSWSRLVEVAGHDGVTRTWHVLENAPAPGAPVLGTILCVHGNPTWSYLWRGVLRQLGDRYRVVAVDQLGMGYSDRTADPRSFAQRVDDLGDVADALKIDGPVVVVAQDWGGPIGLGWVLGHVAAVVGIVLCNTGVAVPAGRKAPALIRLAAAGPLTELVGHRTRIFVEGTLRLSGKRLSRTVRQAFRAPYRRAEHRRAIAEFVADVPFADSYPSGPAVAAVAEGIRTLTQPVLLVWGARDPVFSDDFAMDLALRLPHADRHRFAKVGHLAPAEADVAGVVDGWLAARVRVAPTVRPTVAAAAPIWAGLTRHENSTAVAFVDGATGASYTFAELHQRVMGLAAGLAAQGVRKGHRVAVLVPPSVDLLATVYACWRAGAVTVIADRGLGLRGLGAAVRAAHVDWVIAEPAGVAAARVMRWAPRARAIVVGERRLPGTVATVAQLTACRGALPAEPNGNDPAAVLYTSGATGPAKGVRYLHGQMTAQRDALADLYRIGAHDRLVAAFAPFALYGPALGIASTIPDVDVTKPGTLTAAALATAISSIDATIVFAAPAALANVNRTAVGSYPSLATVRLVLSAGAPVPIATLRATASLCPAAELHTPYGMTECLPVADIDLATLDAVAAGGAAERGAGVCVGHPVRGVEVVIAPLATDPERGFVVVADGTMGEILVRAPWLSEGYDQLWRTQQNARPRDDAGQLWHRTGDVGHLDDMGRLWVEGRTVHVIHADGAPITPVPVEVAVESLDGVQRAAAVGVGPAGCQQLVVVVEDDTATEGVAAAALTARVRAATPHPVAAVLTVAALPVDIRHNTKIDRVAVGRWAAAVLAGDRAKRPW